MKGALVPGGSSKKIGHPHNVILGFGGTRRWRIAAAPEKASLTLERIVADGIQGTGKDMDQDGMAGGTCLHTLGFRCSGLGSGVSKSRFRVYNDWLAEFCSYAPQRLKGLGLIFSI